MWMLEYNIWSILNERLKNDESSGGVPHWNVEDVEEGGGTGKREKYDESWVEVVQN